MKLRKMLSVLCAAALLISALPAASAVEAEPLSEYAGKTLPVQVVEDTDNGLVSRIVEVAIPEGATKAEEDALVYAAAFGTPVTRSANATDTISVEGDFYITNSNKKIGGGTLARDYKRIFVDVNVSLESINTRLWVQYRNLTKGEDSYWTEIPLSSLRVIFYRDNDELPMNQGDDVAIYCHTTGVYNVTLHTCVVQGTTTA